MSKRAEDESKVPQNRPCVILSSPDEPSFCVRCASLKHHHLRRAAELEGVFRAPGVLLTTYGMVQHNAELFCSAPRGLDDEGDDEERPLWDFLILDEVCPIPHYLNLCPTLSSCGQIPSFVRTSLL